MRSASFDRDEVVEKITKAFWENGYEATSIGVLEQATGLKRQSLYNAFGNKDAMFELALGAYDGAVSARLLAALDQPDPRAALRDFFAEQAAILLDETQPSGCLVAGGQQELANRDFALGKRMAELLDEQYAAFIRVFEAWRAQGKLTQDADPEALAALMMAQVRGQSVLGRSSRARQMLERSARVAPDLFERYLSAPSQS